jgi:hypothetical protein
MAQCPAHGEVIVFGAQAFETLHAHLLIHILELENTVTQSNAQQAQLDADVVAETAAVTDLSTRFQAEVDALQQQIANNPTAPASALDLSGFDALIADTQARAAAVPAPVAPVSTPPMVTDPPVTAIPAGKPLYQHVTADAFDPTQWLAAGVNADDGQPLYTFVGDVAGGLPSAASEQWVVYTGQLRALGSNAPTGVAVPPAALPEQPAPTAWTPGPAPATIDANAGLTASATDTAALGQPTD